MLPSTHRPGTLTCTHCVGTLWQLAQPKPKLAGTSCTRTPKNGPLHRSRPAALSEGVSWKTRARELACRCAADTVSSDDVYPPPQRHSLVVDLGGKQILLETGEIGRQANGAILARSGETVIYATACCAKDPPPNAEMDFTPLSVDYQEKFSAAGKTKGGFLKRDRAVDHEILTSRLVDRALRPLFKSGWNQETQLLEWVVSYDGINSTEPLAITAASAALAISDIPLEKPVAGVRIGWKDDVGPILNPDTEEQESSRLDLVMAGTPDAVIMIEGCADFLSEEDIVKALKMGATAVNSAASQIQKWAKEYGKVKQAEIMEPTSDLVELLQDFCGSELKDVFCHWSKAERDSLIEEVWDRVLDKFGAPEAAEISTESAGIYPTDRLKAAFKKLKSSIVRERIFKENKRIDGRSATSVRPIISRANALPRTHGSALFTRGCTQALCVATLGGRKSAQRINSMKSEDDLKFYLQYFFPPSSVNEVRRYGGGANRRELGHGDLACRSLAGIVPDGDEFPYTIRVESTITESDGSSSMASVCGGCLAMMDAGVPIDRMVAGIAMGLILRDSGEYTILSDILGTEDALGDMDFKVAGDTQGITGFQMDMKVEGITIDIISDALFQAKEGRIHILREMEKCSPVPRKKLSRYAPSILSIKIDPNDRGALVGEKGIVIKEITETSGAEFIRIEPDGVVQIESDDIEKSMAAKSLIQELLAKREIGEVFRNRKVVKIMPFGAFVNLLPGLDAMLHISELAEGRTEKVEDVIKEGDVVDVQIVSLNRKKIQVTLQILTSAESIKERERDRMEKKMREMSRKNVNGDKPEKKSRATYKERKYQEPVPNLISPPAKS